MKINMAANVSTLLKAGAMSIMVGMVGLSNAANAQTISPFQMVGGQSCQPANLSQAQIGGGISWQSTGIFNNTGLTLWVICSVPSLGDSNTFTFTRVLLRNNSNQGVLVQAVAKLINEDGTSNTSLTKNTVVQPGDNAISDNFFLTKIASFQTITVSVKLPTGTGVISVTNESGQLL